MNLEVSPASLERGETYSLSVSSDGDFPSGDLEFEIEPASGVSLGQIELKEPKQLTIEASISGDAPLGSRALRIVHTHARGETSFSVVEATEAHPSLSFDPPTVEQGTTGIVVAVEGHETNFDDTSVAEVVEEDSGVEIIQLDVKDGNSAEVILDVAKDALVGVSKLRIVTGDEVADGDLIVNTGRSPPVPTVEVEPEEVQAGTTAELRITGTHTHFSGESEVSFQAGSGIGVMSVIKDNTVAEDVLIAEVDVEKTASLGDAEFTVSSPFGEGYEVVEGSVEITPAAEISVTPSSGWQGEEIEVQILGTNTHFVNPGTGVYISHETDPFASGVQINMTDFLPPSYIEATVYIDEDATPGNWIIQVESNDGTDIETVAAPFHVNEVVIVPVMNAFPDSAMAGETITVLLSGANTSFASGVTTLTTASGDITIDSYAVDDLSQTIDAQITVDQAAVTYDTTLTATTGAEVVDAVFHVLEYVETCDDFTVNPDVVSIGRYGVDIYLTRTTPGWIAGTTEAYLMTSDAHTWLGDPADTPAQRCTVNSSYYAICDFTAGMLAAPGTHEIHMVTGSEALCGLITVEADTVSGITLPASGLPSYNTYSGSLNPATNRSDYYSFSPLAGETWVFHAFSLDRTNLDPVLRLIDAGGDDWLVYVNDETSMGIDSRISYYFAASSTEDYYIEVGPFLTWSSGPYQLYVHRLTHGNVIYEAPAANDDFASAQVLSGFDGTVLYGEISSASDIDVYEIDTTGLGAVAVDVVARRLGSWTGSTADVQLKVYDVSDTTSWVAFNQTWYEIPASEDPRVFLDTEGDYYFVVEPQFGTTGFYGVNFRPAIVINEVDNRTGSTNPFVELMGPASLDLTGYSLCAYDSSGAWVDSSAECVDLAGFSTGSDGYFAAYHYLFADSTLYLPPGAGAVVLREGVSIVDSVQYGAVTSGTFMEGATPAEIGHNRTIGRGAGVDTNDNKMDFIYMAEPTPGQPNDRTHQAAVPLYGETPG